MISLSSSIKEIFTGQPLISFKGGACKARKSVIIDPCTCLPDSNISFMENPDNTWDDIIAGDVQKAPPQPMHLVRGLAFIMKKSEPIIIKEFVQGFYSVLSFTGQQLYRKEYLKRSASHMSQQNAIVA